MNATPRHIASALPLRCRCGRVRGVANEVAPSTGFRFICYCRDCQAFARFLERLDVLDAAGGTDIFQMPPRHIKITKGADAVRCLRLSDRGVFRWYANCCRTPIGNTYGPRVPMIGVMIHSFMDHRANGRSRDVVLGPMLCRIFERDAVGPLPPTAPPPPSFRLFLRRASKMLIWSVRGLARPHPFFDGLTNAPCSAPLVLTREERAAL
jgi:hypothetical protein